MTSVCVEDQAALVMERPGTCLLVGTYRLECLLGHGDKGTAYEATDMDLNSPVIAVELHGTKVIDDPQELQRFHHEARQAARAGGQDVAEMYDYGPLPNGGAYIVMERIKRDSPQEGSSAKSTLIASPAIEESIAPPNNYGRPTSETAHVQSEATTVENTEDDTITFPLRARAESDAEAGPTDEETLTFPALKTNSRRDAVDTATLAVPSHKVPIPQELNLASPSPSPPPPLPPVVRTPTPSTNSDRSAQLASPIVVEVPGESPQRKRLRPLVYLGLAAAVALTSAAVWLAFNNERASLPSTPVASVTSPTQQAPTTSLPTTIPSAAEQIAPSSTGPASSAITVANNPPPVMKTRRRAAVAPARNPRVVLGQALNDWITATTQRDIEWQMSFYAPVLTTYYRQSDVPQDFVREEKARIFAEAPANEPRLLGEPQITFSDRGRVATMRVRISNLTEGGGQNRPGGVIRELRWRKTDEGWKIFSERDL
ncbi:MAG: hypothetical protein H0T92_09375 [Pyrinomonadaceae bacterium]|nr:hypothetical protein [Pyrinomonadaceae bacterium]